MKHRRSRRRASADGRCAGVGYLVECTAEFLHALEALRGIQVETPAYERLQWERNCELQTERVSAYHVGNHIDGRVPRERGESAGHFVHEHTNGPNVAPHIGRTTAENLRGHVGRRPCETPRAKRRLR